MADYGGYTRDAKELAIMQSYPLDMKIALTRNRIYEWVNQFGEDGVVVSFSGGKDSTVLLHLVRTYFPDIKAVFSNTGLEYPEIQRFVMSFDNVDIVRPKMRFDEVISTYGYPLISKEVSNCIMYARKISYLKSTAHFRRNRLLGKQNKCDMDNINTIFDMSRYLPLARDVPVAISHLCCSKMKKSPIKAYQRKNGFVPFLGTLAEESRIRKQAWIRHGCNAFDSKSPTSQPLSFWTEQDILNYIVQNGLEIASVYGDIVAVDSSGNEYPAESTLIDGCKLKCSGCDRTGQINAAR